MTTTTPLRVVIAPSLAERIDATLPDFLDRHAYINLLLSQALDSAGTLGKASPASGGPSHHAAQGEAFPSIDRTLINKSAKKEKNKAPKPAWDKAVPFGLTPHEDLIRDFWRTKKGSKGERAWNLLMGQLESIKVRYGNDVVREQLELAINGRWTSITLANYEKFKPKTEGKDFSKFAHLTGMSFG